MGWFQGVVDYIREHPDRFLDALEAHVKLSLTALIVAMVIFIPLGALASRSERWGSTLVGILSSVRVIPSLALIFLFYPFFGIGFKTALVALVILASPSLILNTYSGLHNVDAAVQEAARGLGMNVAQAFFGVQLPLALPVIVAGIRSATVEIIASATLASFIGVNSLGRFILTGISLIDTTFLLLGGLPIVGLVIVAELLLGGLQRAVTPPAS